jgi:hypothetical protein
MTRLQFKHISTCRTQQSIFPCVVCTCIYIQAIKLSQGSGTPFFSLTRNVTESSHIRLHVMATRRLCDSQCSLSNIFACVVCTRIYIHVIKLSQGSGTPFFSLTRNVTKSSHIRLHVMATRRLCDSQCSLSNTTTPRHLLSCNWSNDGHVIFLLYWNTLICEIMINKHGQKFGFEWKYSLANSSLFGSSLFRYFHNTYMGSFMDQWQVYYACCTS